MDDPRCFFEATFDTSVHNSVVTTLVSSSGVFFSSSKITVVSATSIKIACAPLCRNWCCMSISCTAEGFTSDGLYNSSWDSSGVHWGCTARTQTTGRLVCLAVPEVVFPGAVYEGGGKSATSH